MRELSQGYWERRGSGQTDEELGFSMVEGRIVLGLKQRIHINPYLNNYNHAEKDNKRRRTEQKIRLITGEGMTIKL